MVYPYIDTSVGSGQMHCSIRRFIDLPYAHLLMKLLAGSLVSGFVSLLSRPSINSMYGSMAVRRRIYRIAQWLTHCAISWSICPIRGSICLAIRCLSRWFIRCAVRLVIHWCLHLRAQWWAVCSMSPWWPRDYMFIITRWRIERPRH